MPLKIENGRGDVFEGQEEVQGPRLELALDAGWTRIVLSSEPKTSVPPGVRV